MTWSPSPLAERLRAGDRRAIARAITLMEEGGANAAALHTAILPTTGRALMVGFTGPPGAGKSTLVDAFVAELRKTGRTVGVVAVDPSSPLSGGAVLGDRIRMGRHTCDAGVFIRSIASRGHLGGLTESIHHVVDVLDAAGCDAVVIETVGAGQSEVEIVDRGRRAQFVVNAPGLGDDVQASQGRQSWTIASILVVNKADLPLAPRTVRQLKAMLSLRREGGADVPVLETIASEGRGVAELLAAVDARSTVPPEDALARRRARIRRLVAEGAAAEMRRRILSCKDAAFLETLAQAERSEIGIDVAVRAILEGSAAVAEHAGGSVVVLEVRDRQAR